MADGTLIEFQADLKGLGEVLSIGTAEAVKRVGIALHEAILAKFPVDTGQAIGSNGISLDQVGNYVLPPGEYGREGGASLARQQQAILSQLTKANPYRVVWIYNLLDYVELLEQGSSQQAPLGMFAVSVAEIEAEVQQTIDNTFDALLQRYK